MYFDNHTDFPQARINTALFWEYNLDAFDFNEQIDLVVQRVIERGVSEDFYAMYNLYGKEKVNDAIRKIPLFSQRDMEFIQVVLGVPYTELLAYWNMKKFPNKWPHTGVPIRL
jgi:hypothetical protein